MIISFGKGGSSASSAAAYMLADKDHKGETREHVEVLEGNPKLTASIADSLDFKRTYSAGIIAWAAEEKPTKAETRDVLNKFEELAFAGMKKDQYSWSAVLHKEKNGSQHIHFLIADVELNTGNKFNPAPPGHRKAFDALRDSLILGCGWADPADKDRAQLSQDGYLAHLTDNKNPKKAITQFISSQVEQGLIENRSDIIKSLSGIGEVTREGESYLSIKPKGFEKAIRLKGDLYERKFNTRSYLEAERKNSSEQSRGGRTDHWGSLEAYKRLQGFIASRSRYNQQRYPAGVIKSLENTPVNRLHGLPEHLRSHLGTDVIPVISDNQPDQTNGRTGRDSERGENHGKTAQGVRRPDNKQGQTNRQDGRDSERVESHEKCAQGGVRRPDNKQGQTNRQDGRDSERVESHEKCAQDVRGGHDNQKVREKGASVRPDRRESREVQRRISGSHKKKIESQHDRTRELFTKISADVARRVRDARESVQRFISNLTNSKSRFNETIQRSERAIKRNDRSIEQNAEAIQRIDRSIQQNDRSIQSVTEQQRHSSQISLAIAKRAREIEQRRSRGRDLGWER